MFADECRSLGDMGFIRLDIDDNNHTGAYLQLANKNKPQTSHTGTEESILIYMFRAS